MSARRQGMRLRAALLLGDERSIARAPRAIKSLRDRGYLGGGMRVPRLRNAGEQEPGPGLWRCDSRFRSLGFAASSKNVVSKAN